MTANSTQAQSNEAQQQHDSALNLAAIETCRLTPNSDLLDTGLLAAKLHAKRKADEFMLPQTIFRTADTAGWWHTNSFAPMLAKAEVFATIPPARYFL